CSGDALGWEGGFVGGGGVLTSGKRGVLATGRRSQRATRRGRADACTACRRCLNECREPPNWVLRRVASRPVIGVRSLLDWASTTVAPPISDVANRTVPKIFLIVKFLRLLFPRQRLNLLDPRVGNATRVLLLHRWLSSIVRTRLGDQSGGALLLRSPRIQPGGLPRPRPLSPFRAGVFVWVPERRSTSMKTDRKGRVRQTPASWRRVLTSLNLIVRGRS